MICSPNVNFRSIGVRERGRERKGERGRQSKLGREEAEVEITQVRISPQSSDEERTEREIARLKRSEVD